MILIFRVKIVNCPWSTVTPLFNLLLSNVVWIMADDSTKYIGSDPQRSGRYICISHLSNIQACKFVHLDKLVNAHITRQTCYPSEDLEGFWLASLAAFSCPFLSFPSTLLSARKGCSRKPPRSMPWHDTVGRIVVDVDWLRSRHIDMYLHMHCILYSWKDALDKPWGSSCE